jgi:hypothetical protein
LPHPRSGAVGGEVEDQGQRRFDPDHLRMQRVDDGPQIAARRALIDPRRIGKAVADHRPSRGQRGADRAFQVIASRGGEQQDLGFGRPAVGRPIDQQMSDILGAGRPAGLARQDDIATGRAQGIGKVLRLARFAGAVDPLEGDEPACGHPAGAGPNQRPISTPAATRNRGRKPALATALAVTSGTSTGASPGRVMVSVPAGAPAATGAASGAS